ncbi:hypothetical protein SAMN05216224_10195 [Thioclava dalianensis]|uniref:hypothetical protein n=1 Tax=Thioclava dalianensis TaxID=1185766 RepID=UPI0008F65838|nr:hypothetical protein [Thioclava dalianensis]SFM74060.1 hypothetical protein SAMN05216224_10195 [Thioclava dalianensis]
MRDPVKRILLALSWSEIRPCKEQPSRQADQLCVLSHLQNATGPMVRLEQLRALRFS